MEKRMPCSFPGELISNIFIVASQASHMQVDP